jgi:small-conductance mechanosensitive channel
MGKRSIRILSSPPSSVRVLLLLCLSVAPVALSAQQRESSLSDAEVEKLRDLAYDFPARIDAFTVILGDRLKDIDKLTSARRRAPGREQDIHDDMEQFTSVAEDLEDNLDDYGHRHKDVRKAIPALIAATERWRTTLLAPPANDAYNVSRKLALSALEDIRETASKLLDEQKQYFLAHPPGKESDRTTPPR